MLTFIMLGIVPGTSVQIDFGDWLIVASLFGMLLLWYVVHACHIGPDVRSVLATARTIRWQRLTADVAQPATPAQA